MIERLREVAGEDAVREGSSAAFRVHGRTPAAVVSPGSAEQAADVLRVCSENRWTVEPAGAGTWLDWGRPPERVDVVLTTERLAGIDDYVPADLTISAAAGTPLAEIAETISFDRQTLGLDPPARPGATIGATIATASAGPLRLSLGTPRDQVLGLDIVTGDGRIATIGGRVVKNVAGYDLVRLVVGSRGTLGFITRAHLRLRPASDDDMTALFAADDPRPLAELALGPVSRTWPAAVELFGPALAGALGLDKRWTLAVRSRGNAAFLRAARERLERIGGDTPPDFPDEFDAGRLWDSLSTLEAQAAIAIRLSSLPARLPRLLELAGAAPEHADSRSDNDLDGWLLAAHAGSGILRIWRPDLPRDLDPDSVARRMTEIRASLAKEGGTASLPVIPDALLAAVDPFGEPDATVELARGLKSVFDPAGVLAPGRFIV